MPAIIAGPELFRNLRLRGVSRNPKDRPQSKFSKKELIHEINKMLESFDPCENNTVYVRGACKANGNVFGCDRQQLIAQAGAVMTDLSGDVAAVLAAYLNGTALMFTSTATGDGGNGRDVRRAYDIST